MLQLAATEIPPPPVDPSYIEAPPPALAATAKYFVIKTDLEDVRIELGYPQDLRLAMIHSANLITNGEPYRALALLDALPSGAVADSADWHFLRGSACSFVGRHEAARDEYRASLAITPRSFTTRLALADTLIVLGEFGPARRELKRLAREFEHHREALARVRYGQGVLEYRRGKKDLAAPRFEEAVRLDPGEAIYRYAVAEIYALLRYGPDTEQFKFAFGELLGLLKNAPEDSEIPRRIATLFERVGEVDSAIDWLRRALSVRHGDVIALSRLGQLLLDAGRVQEVIDCVEALGEHARESAIAQTVIGVAYGRAGRPALAADAFRRSLELGSQWAGSHLNYGAALHDLGDYMGAGKATLEALRLEPSNETALSHLAEIARAIVVGIDDAEAALKRAKGEGMSTERRNEIRIPVEAWDVIRETLDRIVSLESSAHLRQAMASAVEVTVDPDDAARSGSDSKTPWTGRDEMRWLAEQGQAYAGSWIALEGSRLVATAATAKEVYAAADAAGVRTPFVTFVEPEEGFAFGGW